LQELIPPAELTEAPAATPAEAQAALRRAPHLLSGGQAFPVQP